MLRVIKTCSTALAGARLATARRGSACSTTQCATSTAALSSASLRLLAGACFGAGDGAQARRGAVGEVCGIGAGGEVGVSLNQSDNSRMKLATYKDGSRDGQLVVVSRDLSKAHYASHIANRLQPVLDDWNYVSPQLQELYDSLNSGRAVHAFPFDPAQCLAPLPRAYQWAKAAAYPSHADLLHKALGLELPEGFHAEPRVVYGASDELSGPHAPIVCANEAWGVDFEAGLAVISGDLPLGCPSDRALDGVRLLVLVNDVRFRNGNHKGSGNVDQSPCTAFSPVAVTPDELGAAWSRGRVHLPLHTSWNGRRVGLCDAGVDVGFHFGQLLAQLCTVRNVRAGSIIGAAPVSNKGVSKGSGSKARTEWPKGYHCIAEKRAMETLQDGQPSTGYLQAGDSIRIEMKDPGGQSIFGAIEQELVLRSVG